MLLGMVIVTCDGHYRGTDTTFGNKCYYIFFLVEASNHSYMSLVYDNCKQT